MRMKQIKKIFRPILRSSEEKGKELAGFLDITTGAIIGLTEGRAMNIKQAVNATELEKMKKGELIPFHTHCCGDPTDVSGADVCSASITKIAYVITRIGVHVIKTKEILSKDEILRRLKRISEMFQDQKVPETHKGLLIEMMLKHEFPAEITLILW